MNLTREQTIKALECCVTANSCDKCPMKSFVEVNECCCDLVKKCAVNYLKESKPLPEFKKENEPAPAATETSSKDNISHLDDNTYRRICQAFESADQAVKGLLELYDNMSEAEQRAFDMGEIYRSMLSASNELEEIKYGDGE